ncbi:MAG: hypothetical protein R3C99_10560 [Pirellulaceae bacterium]
MTAPEMKYLHDRRRALGGYLPSRPTEPPKIEVPKYDEYDEADKPRCRQGH